MRVLVDAMTRRSLGLVACLDRACNLSLPHPDLVFVGTTGLVRTGPLEHPLLRSEPPQVLFRWGPAPPPQEDLAQSPCVMRL